MARSDFIDERANDGTAPTAKRPLRRQVQARFFKYVNYPMRVILGLPFATTLSARLMLASLSGRKTGKRYRQPLSYVRDGDTLLTPGGGRWKLNLIEGRSVSIRIRGKDVDALPELVRDATEVDRLIDVMAAANPGVNTFIGIPRGADGHLNRMALEKAIAFGFRIVRWHLLAPADRDPGRRP